MKLRIFISLGILVFRSQEIASQIDFAEVSLIPNDTSYARYINEALLVSCYGETLENLMWVDTRGNKVENKGRVHVEVYENQLRLVLDAIRKEDEGEWTCMSDDGTTPGKKFVLAVYVPISFDIVENFLVIKETQDVLVPCEVYGNPRPTTNWFFDGEPLADELSREQTKYTKLGDGLLVRNINQDDAGEYTCKAVQITEFETNSEEQTIRLDVHYKPLLYGHHHMNKYGFLNGEVNLTCAADAEPKAEFIWYRKGKRVTHNIHQEENYSELHIPVKSKDVFGEYKCKVRNYLGERNQTFSVHEGKKPERPKTFFLRGLSSDTFDIDVGAKKDPKSTNPMDINGYRFELIPKPVFAVNGRSWAGAVVKEFPIADGVTYLIYPLSADTNYMVRVASRNPAGYSDWSDIKEFATLLKQPYIASGCSRIQSQLMLHIQNLETIFFQHLKNLKLDRFL